MVQIITKHRNIKVEGTYGSVISRIENNMSQFVELTEMLDIPVEKHWDTRSVTINKDSILEINDLDTTF